MNLVDSCGWLEYFANGPNASFFEKPIEDTNRLIVPAICICEVVRRLLQQNAAQDDIVVMIAAMRMGEVIPLNEALALQAAQIGVGLKMPLADSIIFATAEAYGATIWTQDQHFQNLPRVKYKQKL